MLDAGAEADLRPIHVGARVEHPQRLIDTVRYGEDHGPATRQLLPDEPTPARKGRPPLRPAHTFCPGERKCCVEPRRPGGGQRHELLQAPRLWANSGSSRCDRRLRGTDPRRRSLPRRHRAGSVGSRRRWLPGARAAGAGPLAVGPPRSSRRATPTGWCRGPGAVLPRPHRRPGRPCATSTRGSRALQVPRVSSSLPRPAPLHRLVPPGRGGAGLPAWPTFPVGKASAVWRDRRAALDGYRAATAVLDRYAPARSGAVSGT